MHHPRPLSPASLSRLQTKNRRKRYLELHPEYLDNTSLELADPLAYDRLIRHFQSASEREEEGKKKGYSGVLEADLWRAEAKVEAVKEGNVREEAGKGSEKVTGKAKNQDEAEAGEADMAIGAANKKLEDAAEKSLTKAEGSEIWRRQVEMRFVNGGDGDFDYEAIVDRNEELDDTTTVERERQDEWFEDEEEAWIGESATDGSGGGADLRGQTGVQDF